ncbi:MAG: FixH family protein [Pseudomonadales bacterium]|nr:FixH family protein [Pseudomonadales bacterium]
MTQTETRINPQPAWYRQRWPWVLMLVPFAAVLFGMVMVGTAVFFPDDVVVDTYYKQGQGINRLLALDDRATALGLRAELRAELHAQQGETVLSLSAAQGNLAETALQLSVFHVTDSNADREFQLLPLAGNKNRFVSTDAALHTILHTDGVWYLELRGSEQSDNDTWRLRKRIQTPLPIVEF